MNQLRNMSLFARVVEAGSISAAAEQLDLSKSVVSQHLKLLEQELGTVLLKRTTRRQHLTQAGEDFYQRCRELNQIADLAWSEAQQQNESLSGRIRITAPDALMGSLVAPVVAELITDHPNLQPELITSDQQLDLMSEQIDLAIRVGESPASQLKQKRIGSFRDVLCIAPKWRDQPLEQVPYVANTWQGRKIHHQLKNAQGEILELNYQTASRANTLSTCQILLKAGAGIGLLPDFIFQNNLKNKELQQAAKGYQLPEVNVYALHSFQGRAPKAIEILVERIAEKLNQ